MKQRDHKKAHATRQQKYHRLAWEVPRISWELLSNDQQSQCKAEVRQVIKKWVEGGKENGI